MTADKSPEGISEETLENLTAEIRTLRNAVDELRDEFSWAVRNLPAFTPRSQRGVPHAASETDTENADAREADKEDEAGEPLAENLETIFRHLASEQVEIILSALDSVRSDILKAVQQPPSKQGTLPFGETGETNRKRQD